jgi:hypothetical protein
MPVAPTAPPPLADPPATGVSVTPLLIWQSSERRPEPSNSTPGRLPPTKALLVTSSFSSILPGLRLVVRPVLVGWALATWKLDPRQAILKAAGQERSRRPTQGRPRPKGGSHKTRGTSPARCSMRDRFVLSWWKNPCQRSLNYSLGIVDI